MKYKRTFASLMLILCMQVSAALCLAASTIPLSMHNYTSGDVAVAIRYFDAEENRWITFGWLSVPAYTSLHKKLPTQNKTIYFYALNTNGKIYEGSSYNTFDKKFLVSDKPFFLREGEKYKQGTLSSRYFRIKRAEKGSFNFKF